MNINNTVLKLQLYILTCSMPHQFMISSTLRESPIIHAICSLYLLTLKLPPDVRI